MLVKFFSSKSKIIALLILLFNPLSSAQVSESTVKFMLIGGYLIHQHPPAQNYKETDFTGIVEAKMSNTIALGIALEYNPQITNFSFRGEFILFPFLQFDFLNWNGKHNNTDYGNPQVGGNMFTLLGNVIYKPWSGFKPYFIGGIGIKSYSSGSMAETIGSALFGKSNPVITFRIGAGVELDSHFIIELNDYMSSGSFLFSYPSFEEIETPSNSIHDVVILISYIF